MADAANPLADAIAQRVAELLRPSQGIKPRLLTVSQAGVYIGRSEKAVRHLISSGTLTQVKTDARVMLDVQDLDVWIDSNKER